MIVVAVVAVGVVVVLVPGLRELVPGVILVTVSAQLPCPGLRVADVESVVETSQRLLLRAA